MSCIALGGTHLIDPVTVNCSPEAVVAQFKKLNASEAAIQTAVSRLFPLTEVRFGCR